MSRTTRFLLAVLALSVVSGFVADILFPGHPHWKSWRGTSVIPWIFGALTVAGALWFVRDRD